MPYKNTFKKLIGKQIDTIEYYPASEGFFAYQNSQLDKSLLLQYNSGIYYEFIKTNEFENEDAKVALLNIGSEELKGNNIIKNTYQSIR